MLREPVGVAGIMVPWNSPVILMVCSLAPVVAAGTTVVIRMPSQTVQINALLARVMSETPSLPRGVIIILT
jgi:betaine-aldehyde dehydrogenase